MTFKSNILGTVCFFPHCFQGRFTGQPFIIQLHELYCSQAEHYKYILGGSWVVYSTVSLQEITLFVQVHMCMKAQRLCNNSSCAVMAPELPVHEQILHDMSAVYMCSTPHTRRSNRQAHVVPLSSSIPQVGTRGEKGTPKSVTSFCSVYQLCQPALLHEQTKTLHSEG